MSLSKSVLFIACFSLIANSNLVFAAEETEEPTSEQILAHPEVQGALAAVDACWHCP